MNGRKVERTRIKHEMKYYNKKKEEYKWKERKKQEELDEREK